ncbi:MAG: hypothetical protein V5A23_00555 [Halobacteriales archaeon]
MTRVDRPIVASTLLPPLLGHCSTPLLRDRPERVLDGPQRGRPVPAGHRDQQRPAGDARRPHSDLPREQPLDGGDERGGADVAVGQHRRQVPRVRDQFGPAD